MLKKGNHDFAVIGAGIVGSFLTYEIIKKFNKTKSIWWFDQNLIPGRETSKINTHVIHGGFDPKVGSLNSWLSLTGRKIYENEYFTELAIPKLKADTYVLAFNPEEDQLVKELYQRGLQNGLSKKELFLLNSQETRKREPRLAKNVSSSLLCTSSYVTNAQMITEIIWNKLRDNRLVDVKFGHKVIEAKREGGKWKITTQNIKSGRTQVFFAKILINAAGHSASSLAQGLSRKDIDVDIYPRKGQYKIVESSDFGPLKAVFFRVPSRLGKGIAICPTLDRRISLGPTAEPADVKQPFLLNLETIDSIDIAVKEIFPGLKIKENVVAFVSSARSIDRRTDDFVFRFDFSIGLINILGIKSPGISSAPAIARFIVSKIENLNEKSKIGENFIS